MMRHPLLFVSFTLAFSSPLTPDEEGLGGGRVLQTNEVVNGGSCGGPSGVLSAAGAWKSHVGAGVSNYGSSWDCTPSTFVAPVGSVITITITYASAETCCDRVMVYDGTYNYYNGNAGQTLYYLTTVGQSFTSTSNFLTVAFSSDYSVSGLGYRASVTFSSGSSSSSTSSSSSACLLCTQVGQKWCGSQQRCDNSFYVSSDYWYNGYSSYSCFDSCYVSLPSQCGSSLSGQSCADIPASPPAAAASATAGVAVAVILGALLAPLSIVLPSRGGSFEPVMEAWKPRAQKAWKLIAAANAFLSFGLLAGLAAPPIPWMLTTEARNRENFYYDYSCA